MEKFTRNYFENFVIRHYKYDYMGRTLMLSVQDLLLQTKNIKSPERYGAALSIAFHTVFDDDAKKDNCSLKTSRNFWRVARKNVEEHIAVPGYETWSKKWAGKESRKSYKEKTIDRYMSLFQSKNSSYNNNSSSSSNSYNISNSNSNTDISNISNNNVILSNSNSTQSNTDISNISNNNVILSNSYDNSRSSCSINTNISDSSNSETYVYISSVTKNLLCRIREEERKKRILEKDLEREKESYYYRNYDRKHCNDSTENDQVEVREVSTTENDEVEEVERISNSNSYKMEEKKHEKYVEESDEAEVQVSRHDREDKDNENMISKDLDDVESQIEEPRQIDEELDDSEDIEVVEKPPAIKKKYISTKVRASAVIIDRIEVPEDNDVLELEVRGRGRGRSRGRGRGKVRARGVSRRVNRDIDAVVICDEESGVDSIKEVGSDEGSDNKNKRKREDEGENDRGKVTMSSTPAAICSSTLPLSRSARNRNLREKVTMPSTLPVSRPVRNRNLTSAAEYLEVLKLSKESYAKEKKYHEDVARIIKEFEMRYQEFQVEDVTPDGHCQFNSFNNLLRARQRISALAMRGKVVEHVEKYFDYYFDIYSLETEGQSDKDIKNQYGIRQEPGHNGFKNYLDLLKGGNIYGDTLSLIALTNIYKINVCLYHSGGHSENYYWSDSCPFNEGIVNDKKIESSMLFFDLRPAHYSSLIKKR